jgi:hypothetical protein
MLETNGEEKTAAANPDDKRNQVLVQAIILLVIAFVGLGSMYHLPFTATGDGMGILVNPVAMLFAGMLIWPIFAWTASWRSILATLALVVLIFAIDMQLRLALFPDPSGNTTGMELLPALIVLLFWGGPFLATLLGKLVWKRSFDKRVARSAS